MGTINKWEFLTDGGIADFLLKVQHDWDKAKTNRNAKCTLNIHAIDQRRHSYVKPPSFTSKSGKWFDHFDISYEGVLTQKELITGLIVSLNAFTSEQRNNIRQHVISIWNTFDKNKNGVIEKDEFLGGMAQDLVAFAQSWDPDSLLDDEATHGNAPVKIKVNIPEGYESGSLMKVSSPVSQEVVIIMVPDKVKWGGGVNEPYFFTVSFLQ